MFNIYCRLLLIVFFRMRIFFKEIYKLRVIKENFLELESIIKVIQTL